MTETPNVARSTFAPVTGYNAWLIDQHGNPLCLPIVGVQSEEIYYGAGPDEQPSVEHEPMVIPHSGMPLRINDLHDPWAGVGALIGVAPAYMDQSAALAYLARFQVADADALPEVELIDRVTSARRRVASRAMRRQANDADYCAAP